MFRRLMVAGYFLFMTAAFYVTTEYSGGVPMPPVNVRYLIDVIVIGMAFLWFLVTVDTKRLKFSWQMSGILILPYLGIAVVSIVIWLVQCQETSYITRGMINVICAILNVVCISSAYYMFGKKTIAYTAAAAMAAMSVVMFDVIRRFGLGEFIAEYVALLLSFTENTGSAMKQMELHDLIQGLGVFLMYYLFCFMRNRKNISMLLVTAVYFSLGLKRIDVVAIAAACCLGWLFNALSERMKTVMLVVLEIALIVFVYVYLFLIKENLYQSLMSSLGINTMSRDKIYGFYKDFFELTPFFFGYGIRYLFRLREHYLATGTGVQAVDAPHNEFMTHYIELGFWGFLFWLWSNTWYRFSAVRKRWGSESSAYVMMTVVYLFTTYATDNTFFYYSINIASYVTIMAYVDEHKCIA